VKAGVNNMKNNIYAMLNRADINLEGYEQTDLNDIEKKRIKKYFSKSISGKKPGKKRIAASAAAIAAVAVLTIGILGSSPQVASALSDVKNTIGYDIAGFLGIQKNLDEYKTVINKSVTSNSITAKLNEVILDGKELAVSYTITSDRKLKQNESWSADNLIYINGKRVNDAASGSSCNTDDYTTTGVMTYELRNTDLNGDLNIKIRCSEIRLNDEKKRGSWNFEFKTNGDQLKIDTRKILLNNKFTLINGEEYTLEKYTDNKLGQKIFASITNFNAQSKYDVMLKGVDNLGNEVTFYLSCKNKGEAL
jgi:hypothetical protein